MVSLIKIHIPSIGIDNELSREDNGTMKKLLSFTIGMMFAAVVLCFTATPFIMSASADDGFMSDCPQAGEDSSEQSSSACDHQINNDAHFQPPVQISENGNLLFFREMVRGIFQNYLILEEQKFFALSATAPPGNFNHDYLTFSKTVVLRF